MRDKVLAPRHGRQLLRRTVPKKRPKSEVPNNVPNRYIDMVCLIAKNTSSRPVSNLPRDDESRQGQKVVVKIRYRRDVPSEVDGGQVEKDFTKPYTLHNFPLSVYSYVPSYL